jgi:hypothetical protein
MSLESSSVVPGRLEVWWVSHLHIHPKVLRKTTDEELGTLTRGDPLSVARHCLKTSGKLLHS